MPVLVDERIVGRLDLKTDRDAGVLRVQGAYSEPGVDRDAIAERIRPVLAEMAEFVGVDGYVVGRRGDLAGALN
jgi:uncharacterized protein YcaQ